MKFDKAIKIHKGVHFDEAELAVEFFIREVKPLHFPHHIGWWRGGIVRYRQGEELSGYLSVYETRTMYVVRLAQPSKENE